MPCNVLHCDERRGAGDNLISHINHPFPARIVVSELDNVSSNPSHHEEGQTHSVGRVLPVGTCRAG